MGRVGQSRARKADLPAPKLIIVYSPFRQRLPLIEVVSEPKKAHAGRDIAVIIPELIELGGTTMSYTTRRLPSWWPTCA